MHYNSLGILSCFASLAVAGCTATVARWDATNLRGEIMDYYNDEIMDNLIRQKEHLPFVHVDISSVTALSASKISGSVGGGESRTYAKTGMFGTAAMLVRTVARPFAYSLTPEHGDSLTITASPVLGMLPGDKTIYCCYRRFEEKHGSALVYKSGLIPPEPREYVPGTLKQHSGGYYYICHDDQDAYRDLCQDLFTLKRKADDTKAQQAFDNSERQNAAEGLRQ